MNVSVWTDRIIRIGFYLLFGLVPLLLTPWNYELFEYNKMMAVYGLTVIITTAWVVKMIHEKEIRFTRTPLDIPIGLFVLSQFVSSLLSIDHHVSWFGYYSRFNGGMWSVASYVVLYYAFVSNIVHWPHWKNVLKVALTTATVVALYGVAERLGIDKNLWVQDVQNRVFSSLGQPNWLAAYLVALTPLSMAFAIKTRNAKLEVRNYIWALVSILFFVVLLFTRSRSGLLGFAIADAIFWGVLLTRSHPVRTVRNVGILLHLVFALIVFFNGTNIDAIDKVFSFRGLRTRFVQTAAPAPEATASATTAPALETGGTESGVIRQYVWQGALNAWRSSPKTLLVGTGTETFAFAFFRYRPVEHNETSEWDFLYNKAHNEYLNYLATTGALGLGSYLLFIGAFFIWFLKHIRTMNDERITTLALFAGWTSILVTNFFGFSVVVVQLMFFLFPAFVFALQPNELTKLRSYSLRLPSWALWIPVVVGMGVLIVLGRMWWGDTQFESGRRLSRTGNVGAALPKLVASVKLNPSEPLFEDELGSLYASIAALAWEQEDATTSAQFMRESLLVHDRALAISPANVNFVKTRVKIYVTLADIDPQYNTKAIETLKTALTLSPNDPKILYNLAVLSGRVGENAQAIEYLKQAIAMKPNYRDSYFALWVFYTEERRASDARDILKTYLEKVDPTDQDFQERLGST
jgi:O-antigen ligase